ncbi:MAG: glycerol-3-phosphate dehydrogenase [Hyphomicrobiaceae bacterium]
MFDLAVIGGGVNGCGVARDAAGRGCSVLLAEQNDLASGTSSASTKLVHGGLRYLEHYEFRLVREALSEREVLLRAAPHIIWPLRFVLPHHRGLRPAALIRLGLWLYDHLGGREILPGSRGIDLTSEPSGVPLRSEFSRGFEYSDCWVDDARLVVLNARDAADRGADIRVRTEVVAATRSGDHWSLVLEDKATGQRVAEKARLVVNAGGPWVGEVLKRLTRSSAASSRVRLVKGSHIVVPRLYEHERAYIFQNADRRIVFSIPYEADFTLIGTTDVDYAGDPADAAISADEVAYLCNAVSAYFKTSIRPADVVWTYSGVRPLYNEGGGAAQEATRDYVLELDGRPGEPVLLNIFGGKITTYRHLAEEVMKRIGPWLPSASPPWTARAPLPGGEFPVRGFDDLVARLSQRHPAVPAGVVRRLARCYGTVAGEILSGTTAIEDLGQHFGAGLYEREVVHLVEREWARTVEDILWRRTKLGLRLDAGERQRLADWLAAQDRQLTSPAA